MCLNKNSSFVWKGYILLSKFLKEGYIFSPNYSKFVLHMHKHGTNILPKCPPGSSLLRGWDQARLPMRGWDPTEPPIYDNPPPPPPIRGWDPARPPMRWWDTTGPDERMRTNRTPMRQWDPNGSPMRGWVPTGPQWLGLDQTLILESQWN